MARLKRCILVSGLPGSGKSTVGRALATELGADLFDKDDYLERLFVARGIGDDNWRQQLSRESDRQFEHEARGSQFAVLVSHWRPRGSDATSGTACDWVVESFEHIVELFCDCPIEVAAARFEERQRHPGHLDAMRNAAETLDWLRVFAGRIPLGIGQLVRIDTTGEAVDLATRIDAAFADTDR